MSVRPVESHIFSAFQKQKNARRLLAMLLAWFFLWPQLLWAFETPAFTGERLTGPVLSHKLLILPKTIGTVRQVSQGRGKSIIVVQDLHCHYELQTNIKHLLELLSRDYGLKLVGMEGAFQTVNASRLRRFPDVPSRNAVCAYLAQQGKLSGAEWAAAVADEQIRLEGVDTPTLYAQSLAAMQQFLNDESLNTCENLKTSFGSLEKRWYSPRLLAWRWAVRDFQAGRSDLLRFCLTACQTARAAGINPADFPRVENYSQAQVSGTDLDGLQPELEQLDRAISGRLANSGREKQLLEVDRRLGIVERLLNISATPEDLAQFRAAPQTFSADAFLQAATQVGASETEINPGEFKALDAYLLQSSRFYVLAENRSREFVKNLEMKMDRLGVNEAALVVGSFHTPGVLEALKADQTSYALVVPRMTRLDLVNPYFTLLEGARTNLEKLLERNAVHLALPTRLPDTTFLPDQVVPQGKLGSQAAKVFAGLSESLMEQWWISRLARQGRALRVIQQECQAGLDRVYGKDDNPGLRPEQGLAQDNPPAEKRRSFVVIPTRLELNGQSLKMIAQWDQNRSFQFPAGYQPLDQMAIDGVRFSLVTTAVVAQAKERLARNSFWNLLVMFFNSATGYLADRVHRGWTKLPNTLKIRPWSGRKLSDRWVAFFTGLEEIFYSGVLVGGAGLLFSFSPILGGLGVGLAIGSVISVLLFTWRHRQQVSYLVGGKLITAPPHWQDLLAEGMLGAGLRSIYVILLFALPFGLFNLVVALPAVMLLHALYSRLLAPYFNLPLGRIWPRFKAKASGRNLGAVTRMSPEDELAKLEKIHSELQQELAQPGSVDLPKIVAVSDVHGSLAVLDELLLHALRDTAPTGLKLSRKLNPAATLNQQGINLKLWQGRLFFENLGDLLDKNPAGLQAAARIKELVEAGLAESILGNHDLYALMNLSGLHLPSYEGFEFYGYRDAYGDVATLWKQKFQNDPAVRNQSWWAKKLAEYQDQQRRLQPRWNKALDKLAKYEKKKDPEWRDFFAAMEFVGCVSIGYWQSLLQRFEQRGKERDRKRFAKVIKLIRDEILPTRKADLAEQVKAGNWWCRVFDAINDGFQRTPEWKAQEWILLDVCGRLTLEEANRIRGPSEPEVTSANYLDQPVFRKLKDFFQNRFQLFSRDFYQNHYLHAILPVDPKTSEFVFTYKGVEYRGKGAARQPSVWEGLRRIEQDFRNPQATLPELREAFTLFNQWYLAGTRQTEPTDVSRLIRTPERLETFCIVNGLNRLFTGHVPLVKFYKLTDKQRGQMEGFQTGERFFAVDHAMSLGAGAAVHLGPAGVHLYGFELGDAKLKFQPQTVDPKKRAEKVFENPGVPGKQFLKTVLHDTQERIRELRMQLGVRPQAQPERSRYRQQVGQPEAVAGSMPWLRNFFGKIGVSGRLYDKWISWWLENILSLAAGGVVGIPVWLATGSFELAFQAADQAAWPAFLVGHGRQKAWSRMPAGKRALVISIAIVNSLLSIFFPAAPLIILLRAFFVHALGNWLGSWLFQEAVPTAEFGQSVWQRQTRLDRIPGLRYLLLLVSGIFLQRRLSSETGKNLVLLGSEELNASPEVSRFLQAYFSATGFDASSFRVGQVKLAITSKTQALRFGEFNLDAKQVPTVALPAIMLQAILGQLPPTVSESTAAWLRWQAARILEYQSGQYQTKLRVLFKKFPDKFELEPLRYSVFFRPGRVEGPAALTSRLHDKGGRLAEMCRLNLPVPPGFTLGPDISLKINQAGMIPLPAEQEIAGNLYRLSQAAGLTYGDHEKPLFLSVRSGADVTMPGLMKTVTNLGLNDETVQGLAELTKDAVFAYRKYAEFIAEYGAAVMGVEEKQFKDKCLQWSGQLAGRPETVADLQHLIWEYKNLVQAVTGQPFPQDAGEQLQGAIRAVAASWEDPVVLDYRARKGIPDTGTGVTIQKMVFGDRNLNSGAGVAYSRDLYTGERRLTGNFEPKQVGSRIVLGQVTPESIQALQEKFPLAYEALAGYAEVLENRFLEIQDIEYIIENGELFLLQSRDAGDAVFPVARVQSYLEMVQDGKMTEEAMIQDRMDLDELYWAEYYFLAQRIALPAPVPLAWGRPAAPGIGTGQAVFSVKKARELAAAGQNFILIQEISTSQDEIVLNFAECAGSLDLIGSPWAHAPSLLRKNRNFKPAVVAVQGPAEFQNTGKRVWLKVGSRLIQEGELLTLDGNTGAIYPGQPQVVNSPIYEKDYQYHLRPRLSEADTRLWELYGLVLKWKELYKAKYAREETEFDAIARQFLAGENIPNLTLETRNILGTIRRNSQKLPTAQDSNAFFLAAKLSLFHDRNARVKHSQFLNRAKDLLLAAEPRRLAQALALLLDARPEVISTLFDQDNIFRTHNKLKSVFGIFNHEPEQAARLLDLLLPNLALMPPSELEQFTQSMHFILIDSLPINESLQPILEQVNPETLANLVLEWMLKLPARGGQVKPTETAPLVNRAWAIWTRAVLRKWQEDQPEKYSAFWRQLESAEDCSGWKWHWQQRLAEFRIEPQPDRGGGQYIATIFQPFYHDYPRLTAFVLAPIVEGTGLAVLSYLALLAGASPVALGLALGAAAVLAFRAHRTILIAVAARDKRSRIGGHLVFKAADGSRYYRRAATRVERWILFAYFAGMSVLSVLVTWAALHKLGPAAAMTMGLLPLLVWHPLKNAFERAHLNLRDIYLKIKSRLLAWRSVLLKPLAYPVVELSDQIVPVLPEPEIKQIVPRGNLKQIWLGIGIAAALLGLAGGIFSVPAAAAAALAFWKPIEPLVMSAAAGGLVCSLVDVIGQRLSNSRIFKWRQALVAGLLGSTFGMQMQLLYSFIDWAVPSAGWGASGLGTGRFMQALHSWNIQWVRSVLSLGTELVSLEYWFVIHLFAKGFSLPTKNDFRKISDFLIASIPLQLFFNYILQNNIALTIRIAGLVLPTRVLLTLGLGVLIDIPESWALNQTHPLRTYVRRGVMRLVRSLGLIPKANPSNVRFAIAGLKSEDTALRRAAYQTLLKVHDVDVLYTLLEDENFLARSQAALLLAELARQKNKPAFTRECVALISASLSAEENWIASQAKVQAIVQLGGEVKDPPRLFKKWHPNQTEKITEVLKQLLVKMKADGYEVTRILAANRSYAANTWMLGHDLDSLKVCCQEALPPAAAAEYQQWLLAELAALGCELDMSGDKNVFIAGDGLELIAQPVSVTSRARYVSVFEADHFVFYERQPGDRVPSKLVARQRLFDAWPQRKKTAQQEIGLLPKQKWMVQRLQGMLSLAPLFGESELLLTRSERKHLLALQRQGLVELAENVAPGLTAVKLRWSEPDTAENQVGAAPAPVQPGRFQNGRPVLQEGWFYIRQVKAADFLAQPVSKGRERPLPVKNNPQERSGVLLRISDYDPLWQAIRLRLGLPDPETAWRLGLRPVRFRKLSERSPAPAWWKPAAWWGAFYPEEKDSSWATCYLPDALLESVLQPQPRGWFSRLLGQGRRLQFAFLARQLVGNAYQRTPDGGWEGKRLQLRPKLSRIFRQRA